jgi:hypothetical protein
MQPLLLNGICAKPAAEGNPCDTDWGDRLLGTQSCHPCAPGLTCETSSSLIVFPFSDASGGVTVVRAPLTFRSCRRTCNNDNDCVASDVTAGVTTVRRVCDKGGVGREFSSRGLCIAQATVGQPCPSAGGDPRAVCIESATFGTIPTGGLACINERCQQRLAMGATCTNDDQCQGSMVCRETSPPSRTCVPLTSAITCTPGITTGTPTWNPPAVALSAGIAGIRAAIATANSSHWNERVRIDLASGMFTGGSIGDNCIDLMEGMAPNHNRTPDATLTIQGAPTMEGTTILCTSSGGDAVFMVRGTASGPAQNIIIRQLKIGVASGHQNWTGIHIAGVQLEPENARWYGRNEPSSNILIQDVTFNGMGLEGSTNNQDAIKINQAHDIWLIHNTVRWTSRHGFDAVGVRNLAVCDNDLQDTSSGSDSSFFGIEAKGGSSDILFDRNLITNAGSGLCLGGQSSNRVSMDPVLVGYEATRVVARNNVIVNARNRAVQIAGCRRCAFVGNTVWYQPGPMMSGSRYMIQTNESRTELSGGPVWGSHDGIGAVRILPSRFVDISHNLFANYSGGDVTRLSYGDPDNILFTRNYGANFWWKTDDATGAWGDNAPPGVSGMVISIPSSTMSTDVNVTTRHPVSGGRLFSYAGMSPAPAALLGSVDRDNITRTSPPTIGAFQNP